MATPIKLCPAPHVAECAALLARPMVFVHGVFDGLQPLQRAQIEAAGQLGSTLVVGLQSDLPAGPSGRPTRQTALQRAGVLNGMAAVTMIVMYDGELPLQLAAALRPQLWAWIGDAIAPEAAAMLAGWNGRSIRLSGDLHDGWTFSDRQPLRSPQRAA